MSLYLPPSTDVFLFSPPPFLRSRATLTRNIPKMRDKKFRFSYVTEYVCALSLSVSLSVGWSVGRSFVGWFARAPFVYAVCQCAGLDSRGFNTRYRGDCCSLSACSTQPNDRLSSHRGAQPPFAERRVPRTSSTARTRPGTRLLLGTYALGTISDLPSREGPS